jgi:hypothetical protein
MRGRIFWLTVVVALLLPLFGSGCGDGKKRSGDPKLVGPEDPTAQPMGAGAGGKGARPIQGENKSVAQ